MARLQFAARFFCVVLMAVWVGALASFGTMILPKLHALFTVPRTAPVTRHFTANLNLFGLATLAAWAVMLAASRRGWSRRALLATWIALTTSAVLLAAQFALHGLLSQQMELRHTGAQGFHPAHQVYLLAGAVQWLVNLALIALAMSPGAPEPRPGSLPD